jgi:hypothetical protein
VRLFGGVLEHPAYSLAWPHFGLPRPVNKEQWSQPDTHGGRSIHVEQGHYGHRARKGTYLYAVGTAYPDLPRGKSTSTCWVSSLGRSGSGHSSVCRGSRLSCAEAKATPPAFRVLLLRLARSVLLRDLRLVDDGTRMVAGWPTPEQYEAAAQRALTSAERVRQMKAVDR